MKPKPSAAKKIPICLDFRNALDLHWWLKSTPGAEEAYNLLLTWLTVHQSEPWNN